MMTRPDDAKDLQLFLGEKHAKNYRRKYFTICLVFEVFKDHFKLLLINQR